jgi:DNA-binding MarR family transcriptional regulator
MPSASQAMTVDQCNCFTVRKAARQVSRFYDGHLQSTGLRITQFLILATVKELGSPSVNELSERLDIERTATGKMAAVLQRDGLVSMLPSPMDARSRIVQLTKEGQRLFLKALPLWQAAQRQFSELNGQERVDVVRENLNSLAIDESVAINE